ncbi:MAG: thioredoxin family protein [Candidatus Aminicenantes bacterium]|nr:thioredoxin family protein [Candidatus Aminicenantes bacterium]
MICSNQRFWPALAIFGLATLGIFCLTNAAQVEKAAEIGSLAPDFSLPDLSGHVYRLSDYRGKVVVLEWTNPHCPFVVRHYEGKSIPDLQRKSAGKGIVWLTINSTNPGHDNYESPEKLKEIYTGWNAGFTALLMDPDGKVGKSYQAQTTPHLFILNKDGILVYQGAIDSDPRGNQAERTDYVDLALEEVLAGKAVSTPATKAYGCSVKY